MSLPFLGSSFMAILIGWDGMGWDGVLKGYTLNLIGWDIERMHMNLIGWEIERVHIELIGWEIERVHKNSLAIAM